MTTENFEKLQKTFINVQNFLKTTQNISWEFFNVFLFDFFRKLLMLTIHLKPKTKPKPKPKPKPQAPTSTATLFPTLRDHRHNANANPNPTPTPNLPPTTIPTSTSASFPTQIRIIQLKHFLKQFYYLISINYWKVNFKNKSE